MLKACTKHRLFLKSDATSSVLTYEVMIKDFSFRNPIVTFFCRDVRNKFENNPCRKYC